MDSLFHPLRVAQVVADRDADAVLVSFDVPDALRETFRFDAGQHLTLRRTFDGVEQRRSYSICAGADDGQLCVGVRNVPGGLFSGWLNTMLAAGDRIDVMAPAGRFVVHGERSGPRHVLGLAAGSGITPVLSILKTLLARDQTARFTLLYANRTRRSTMFNAELDDLKDRYLSRFALHRVLSQEHADLPLYAGRLDRSRIGAFFERGLLDAARLDDAFVCGPHGFNDEAVAALHAAGWPDTRIHVERFGVAAAERAVPSATLADAAAARVLVIRDGVRREIAFQAGQASVLDAAEAAGLDLPYSCRSGVCCTCRARVLEGEVRMQRNFALEADELAAGFVLSCQAVPVTERVVLSFDER